MPALRRLASVMLACGLIVAAGLIGAALGCGAARAQSAAQISVPSGTAGFTPEQRAEIVGIVRAALRTDPSILRDAIIALQQDEQQAQQAAARVAIGRATPALAHAEGDPTAGNPNGDVTLVEFYDLRCPYCRRMLPVVAELLRVEPRVRIVYKDIPILGPASVLGARAVLAAQRQGGYVRLHDAIMTGPANITEDSLRAAVAQAGLDWDRLRHDMADPAVQSRLDANLQLARQLGIDGTPAYVVGRKLISGAASLDELRDAVAAARAG
jgi:protein-disulfide isomerase